jgi:hypothetical protein
VLVTTLLFNGSTAPQLTSGVSSTASRVGSSRWNLAAALIKSVPIELVRGDGMGRCDLLAPNIEADRRRGWGINRCAYFCGCG